MYNEMTTDLMGELAKQVLIRYVCCGQV